MNILLLASVISLPNLLDKHIDGPTDRQVYSGGNPYSPSTCESQTKTSGCDIYLYFKIAMVAYFVAWENQNYDLHKKCT